LRKFYDNFRIGILAQTQIKTMAQFIKVKQKDDVELLINSNIIETIFPDRTVERCKSLINFTRPSAKKSFYVQQSVDEIWEMILL
jgi:hypothetical protein